MKIDKNPVSLQGKAPIFTESTHPTTQVLFSKSYEILTEVYANLCVINDKVEIWRQPKYFSLGKSQYDMSVKLNSMQLLKTIR